MSNRTLTAEDYEAARVFAEAVAASGKSHEQLGAEVGVSAGMIYQWAKPLRAISVKRAPAAALAVGIDDPTTISTAYAEFIRSASPEARLSAPISARETDSDYVRVEQIDAVGGMGDGWSTATIQK